MQRLIVVLLFVVLSKSIAQQYPDTLWIPVTYFDFHSDGSNPEFECDYMGGHRTDMIADTLDSEWRPVPGSEPYINHYCKYWFRDWNNGAKGDFTKPLYTKVSGGTSDAVILFEEISSVDHDTAFKNIVIEDSLPFIRKDNGMYEYRNESFFPLDGRGFGNEGRSHNYSFTMVLHYVFTKTRGQTFQFIGDDDVWAFVNGKKVMDLGGIHTALAGGFLVDTIEGLENGANDLHLFYAERHTNESSICITTDMSIETGMPEQISLELSLERFSTGNLLTSSLSDVVLSQGRDSCFAYVIIRDHYGNMVRGVTGANWMLLVPPGSTWSLDEVVPGEVVIRKGEPGTVGIVAQYGDFTDTAFVTSGAINVKADVNGDVHMRDTISVKKGEEATLFVQVYSHENGIWENRTASWVQYVSGSLPHLPVTQNQLTFSQTDTGTYIIRATVDGQSGEMVIVVIDETVKVRPGIARQNMMKTPMTLDLFGRTVNASSFSQRHSAATSAGFYIQKSDINGAEVKKRIIVNR